MTFSGVFQHAIDAKGRTSLPARFREVLAAEGADKLYVTTDLFENFLLAFPPSQWNAFLAKVGALPQFDSDTRTLIHSVISPAQECPFDKLGRILLPQSLRDHAGLEGEVVWAGSIQKIELWSESGWKNCQKALRKPDVQADVAKRLGKLL